MVVSSWVLWVVGVLERVDLDLFPDSVSDSGLSDFDAGYLSSQVSAYLEWVSSPVYVCLYGFNQSLQNYEYRWFRSRKRGDSKYARHIESRFDALARIVPETRFFGFGVHGSVESRCLYLTLTYSRSLGLRDVWRSVGSDFNGFLSRLRHLYGKLGVVRCWESQEDGFAHVHAVVLFEDHVFSGRSWRSPSGSLSYRVVGADRDSLKGSWGHGFMDICMMSSVKAGFRYIKKYLSKSVRSDGDSSSKQVKTLAMCWDSHKRSFSMSGYWGSSSHDLISPLTNSTRFTPYEACLDGSKRFLAVQKWYLMGFFVSSEVKWLGDFGVLPRADVKVLFESPYFHRNVERSFCFDAFDLSISLARLNRLEVLLSRRGVIDDCLPSADLCLVS